MSKEEQGPLAKTQARAGNNGNVPPADRQFGQPNGNPRGHGFWKKEATARFKLERMIEMSDDQLTAVLYDKTASRFERDLAQVLLDQPLDKDEKYDASSKWKIIADMINQVYGYPKVQQQVEMELPTPLVDLTKRKKNG